MKRCLIFFRKRQLRRRYLAYRAIADEYSCGHALASHISGRYCRARDRVNESIRKLKVLDPAMKIDEL